MRPDGCSWSPWWRPSPWRPGGWGARSAETAIDRLGRVRPVLTIPTGIPRPALPRRRPWPRPPASRGPGPSDAMTFRTRWRRSGAVPFSPPQLGEPRLDRTHGHVGPRPGELNRSGITPSFAALVDPAVGLDVHGARGRGGYRAWLAGACGVVDPIGRASRLVDIAGRPEEQAGGNAWDDVRADRRPFPSRLTKLRRCGQGSGFARQSRV